jgi:hypothetical protein
MNKKFVYLGLLLLAGMILSNCAGYSGYGNYSHPYDYGYYNYGYYDYGYYPFPYWGGYYGKFHDRDDFYHGGGEHNRGH